ncbi:MAG: ABC transporter ATP-binding protein [Phaeodactylibacter sp.]|uniref:ABC transporter ATP-binding protein n=1 Tax=Phaeodactylibacter sp. TaxID=1940289 RepID=UPI0032EF0C2F
MIKTQGLTRRFGDFTAVRDVSFELQKGETLALIGPSGCGKTTTLKMLNRLITPSAGQVWVNGQEISQQPVVQLRRKMGYVIQDMGLFPHYTVAENIAVVPRLLGWEKPKIQARTGALLEQLGLGTGAFAQKYPHELSGGQQQRVGIARALAANPPIVLMDEPFGALDPLTRQQIRRDFMELEELRSKTTIMVTHDIEEAFEMGSLICLLNQGAVQQLGPPEALLQAPANDFVADFVSEKAAELELRSAKLQDIFNQLPQQSPAEGGALPLAPTLPLLRAIYQLAKAKGQHPLGSTTQDGQKRYFTLSILIEAFKNNLQSWAN